MTLTFSPGTDFADVVDGLAAVTFRNASGSDTSVSNCLRRAISTREAAVSEGKYTTSDVRFHFPSSSLASAPKLGEHIIEGDGTAWVILEVGKETLGYRYRCTCRALAIVAGLDQLVDIERATFSVGEHGERVPTWGKIHAALAAKIQKLDARPQPDRGQRFMAATHAVYFAVQKDIQANDRVVWQGTAYTVIRASDFDSLTGLWQALVSFDPWEF